MRHLPSPVQPCVARQIDATPRDEYMFAYLDPDDEGLPKATLGIRTEGDKSIPLGSRLPRKREIDWRRLGDVETLRGLLNECLKSLDLTYTLTVEEVQALNITTIELMLCTMYTGVPRIPALPVDRPAYHILRHAHLEFATVIWCVGA